MATRIPVRTVAECEALDSDEMIEGYHAGRAGEPEPGDNRSLAFWHGWRNGAADGGYRTNDDAQRALAREYLDFWRAQRTQRAVTH